MKCGKPVVMQRRNQNSRVSVLPARAVDSARKPTGLRVLCLSLLLMAGVPEMATAQNCTAENATPLVCPFDSTRHAGANTKLRHVLLYDWSAGGHSRVHTQRHLLRLSQKYGFRLDRSQDSTYVTAATLQGVDLVVINNSDGDPFGNPASLAAIRNFVEIQGKAILLIHAAASFIPCSMDNLEDPNCRWLMRAVRTQILQSIPHSSTQRATIYADSVKIGEIPPNAQSASPSFAANNPAVPATRNHGRSNAATRMIFEGLPSNGASGPLANRSYIWEGLWDEWATYRFHPRLEGARILDGVTYGPINQLLSLDETTNSYVCNTGPCKMGDRAVSWTHTMGNGLAAYNNAGHGDVYVRTRLVGGQTVNDSLMEKYNWRLMKYLARDFVGCMVPGDANHNPKATVLTLTPSDPACPCAQSSNCIVNVQPETGPKWSRIRIQSVSGELRVSVSHAGPHEILVMDISGRKFHTATIAGGGNELSINGLSRGVYLVELQDAQGYSESKRILMD